jgi:hypothetical protein
MHPRDASAPTTGGRRVGGPAGTTTLGATATAGGPSIADVMRPRASGMADVTRVRSSCGVLTYVGVPGVAPGSHEPCAFAGGVLFNTNASQ